MGSLRAKNGAVGSGKGGAVVYSMLFGTRGTISSTKRVENLDLGFNLGLVLEPRKHCVASRCDFKMDGCLITLCFMLPSHTHTHTRVRSLSLSLLLQTRKKLSPQSTSP